MAKSRALLQQRVIDDMNRLENQKIADACMIELKIDHHDFNRAYTHYNLDKNGKLSGFRDGLNTAARMEREKEEKEPLLKPEEAKELAELVKELGKPQYKQDGTLEFDYFHKCNRIISSFNARRCDVKDEDFLYLRRKYIKEQVREKYEEVCNN